LFSLVLLDRPDRNITPELKGDLKWFRGKDNVVLSDLTQLSLIYLVLINILFGRILRLILMRELFAKPTGIGSLTAASAS
jgi:hypothetical protein